MVDSDNAISEVSRGLTLFANVGCTLLYYNVDVENAALVERGSVEIPAVAQYAWPHSSGEYLYIASSNRRPGEHYLSAFRIDPRRGELSGHGDSVVLPARPVHVSADIPCRHVLVAYPEPSSFQIFRVNEDCTVGREVPQPEGLDAGNYAHQIRVTPDNQKVILVTKGHSLGDPESPGALKVFAYNHGVVSDEKSIVPPEGGRRFSPRHLDFHPSEPWIYASLEEENQIYMYRMENGGIAADAAYRKESLLEPSNVRPRQVAGAIHVHPNGRFVYVGNRADATVEFNGQKVFTGGENNIAVFSIDQSTGEPILIQNAETHKIHCRTFHIDPSGRIIVAQHIRSCDVREDDNVRRVAAGLTVFRIEADGKLTFVRSYDVGTGEQTMFWMGMARMRAIPPNGG